MKSSAQVAFDKLKPVCIPLTKSPTVENTARLRDALRDLDSNTLQELQEYVLFPLRLALRSFHSLSDNKCIAVLDCITDVLKKTTVTKWEVFQDFFNCLCLLLSSPGQGINQGSDEQKTAIVKCLNALVSQSSPSVTADIYHVEFLPALGHAISSLLALTQHERDRKLKVSAMDCLLTLAQSGKKGDVLNLMCRVGDVFASFLPGIAIALSKVITGDVKQGQAVTARAIVAWGNMVGLVLGDVSLKRSEEKKPSEKAKNEKLQNLIIERSPEWVKATTEKLDILIGRIVTLTSHANWKVRLAMVNWAEQLLMECQGSLKQSIPKLLEAVVSLTNDDYPNVSRRSQKVLEEYKKSQTREGAKTLVELLEENLHALATSLPRMIRTADDDEKLKIVRLLSGYLKILGPSVGSMFNSSPHLRRLGWSLMQVVELSCHDLKIMEERTVNIGSSESLKGRSVQTILKPKKSFKHFTDENIFSQICSTCHLLGFHGDMNVLVDYFIEQILTSRLYRKEAILILNEIILGCCGDEAGDETDLGETGKKDSLVDTISSLTEMYVSDALFNVATSMATSGDHLKPINMTHLSEMLECTTISRQEPSPTLLNMNSNIQQVCLFLEGIANFAKVLGEGFRPLLIIVLYPLLEKLADDTLVISQSALYTLQSVCDSCIYSCISELICSNVDYLINTISLKMRHFSSTSRAPLVLGVMLDHSSQELLPYLEDTIQEILQSLDDYHVKNSFLFMRVLAKLISAINRWFGKKQESADTPSETSGTKIIDDQKPKPSFRDFFLEYHRQQQIARMNIECEDEEVIADAPVSEDLDDPPDVKKQIPHHVRCVTSTLDKCCHLLAAKDPRLRLLVLDIICEGCAAIQDDKDELLPAAHKVWSPLVERFQDDEPVVIIKTFETLCIIGDFCGDFLSRRVSKEILPKVADYLRKQAPVSERIGPNQKFSLGYKSQLAILQRIGKLCKEININEEICEKVITGCLPYLSSRQPLPLQQACFETFTALIEVDPDIVWLRLMDAWCPSVPTPPHPTFQPIKFAGMANRTLYSENIETLLEILQKGEASSL